MYSITVQGLDTMLERVKGGHYTWGRRVYVRVGHFCIVDLAHLAVVTMFLTSACWEALRAFSLGLVLP